MILVAKERGSIELLPIIRGIGVQAEKADLKFGDFCFEGRGPKGDILIGIERKTLSDIMHCIDDARYSAHQKVGMEQMYGKSFLLVEGVWAMGSPPFYQGVLITSRDGSSWGPFRYRSKKVMYSKLYRYLISVSLSGVATTYSRNMHHTACNVVEMYHYFQKRWQDHTSLLETQKLAIPQLSGHPSLCRMWAADIKDIGVKFSMDAERMFKTPVRLANSEERDWLQIQGVGPKTARQVIREIQGWK